MYAWVIYKHLKPIPNEDEVDDGHYGTVVSLMMWRVAVAGSHQGTYGVWRGALWENERIPGLAPGKARGKKKEGTRKMVTREARDKKRRVDPVELPVIMRGTKV